MLLFEYYVLTLGITSGLLIVAYTLTLVRVVQGKAFKRIILIISMLLIANVAYLVEAYGQYKYFSSKGAGLKWDQLANTSYPIGDLMFAEAHWLFAFYYMRIAKNMPRVIEQQDEPHRDYKAVFWAIAAINAILAVGELSSLPLEYNRENKFIQLSLVISEAGVLICEIGSGCVLIWSVACIWNYLHKTDDKKERFNLQALVIHSTAFALFLVSTATFAVFYSIYILKGTQNFEAAMLSNIIYYILSFISQCLMCVIFWVLSIPDEEQESVGTESFQSVRVEEYDQDAELQARIWNQFMRHLTDQTNSATQSTNSRFVTPEQVMSYTGTISDMKASLNRQDE